MASSLACSTNPLLLIMLSFLMWKGGIKLVWLLGRKVQKDCRQISLQVPSLTDRDAGLHQEMKLESYERDRRSEEEDEYEEEEEDGVEGEGVKGGEGKGRLRICFDPELELPRLQDWFRQNQHPTRKQVKYQHHDKGCNISHRAFKILVRKSGRIMSKATG